MTLRRHGLTLERAHSLDSEAVGLFCFGLSLHGAGATCLGAAFAATARQATGSPSLVILGAITGAAVGSALAGRFIHTLTQG